MIELVFDAWTECTVMMGICAALGLVLCVVMYFATRELENFYHDIVRSYHDKAG